MSTYFQDATVTISNAAITLDRKEISTKDVHKVDIVRRGGDLMASLVLAMGGPISLNKFTALEIVYGFFNSTEIVATSHANTSDHSEYLSALVRENQDDPRFKKIELVVQEMFDGNFAAALPTLRLRLDVNQGILDNICQEVAAYRRLERIEVAVLQAIAESHRS